MITIGITTGDKDGIGLEVTKKALKQFNNKEDVQFVVWHAGATQLDGKITEIINTDCEVSWFKSSINFAKNNKINAIVTGPLSKQTIKRSNLGNMGHTEILKSEFPQQKPFMLFSGEFFNTLLLTTHLPIKDITTQLTSGHVIDGILAAKKWATSNNDNRPVALVGLNPHAGENGLIGSKDHELGKLCKEYQIEGPLVPDVAFLRKYWDKYSIYICCYHDQALIPFKMAHDHKNACQITWGLPIVRTSVDHGTAKDIFDQNKASEDSMVYAIKKAIQLAKNNN